VFVHEILFQLFWSLLRGDDLCLQGGNLLQFVFQRRVFESKHFLFLKKDGVKD
jgi:hypothetical protein